MTKNRLTAFEYKRLTSIMIRIIVALLLVFIFLALGVNIKYFSNLSFILVFVGITLCIRLLLTRFFSPLVYRNTAEIYFSEDQLIVKGKAKLTKKFTASQITKLKFYYKGDLHWRAIYPLFQKLKSRRRYTLTRSAYSIDVESFDQIIINSVTYFIKIKDQSDKNYFYQIMEWADRSNIKYDLIETKTYAEYK